MSDNHSSDDSTPTPTPAEGTDAAQGPGDHLIVDGVLVEQIEEPDDLDGFTLDDLADYLDSGRIPVNPAIESSPGCQMALSALDRLQHVTWSMLEAEAKESPERDNIWIAGLLDNIRQEIRSGRDIPLTSPDPTVRMMLSEGSVRGLVRAACDQVDGVLIGRCVLTGDVTIPGEPIDVDVTASVGWGENLHQLARELRSLIRTALARHTELNVKAVNVTIQDIHTRRTRNSKDRS
ncbi:Asp23/Gls24 family envelope stress response protein [Frondihabitans sp. PAMC 28766]|uniref:Asp23/Gls24 family envelope stress response protein n=1 Tax=Frondihabitans sp. PAMC 28766 TaxID=1795630 RepID=UPI0012FF6BFE|nr:Asp23/Gls24 family envelope stress response protein [Frondihabitans sp. PAMC 28766]